MFARRTDFESAPLFDGLKALVESGMRSPVLCAVFLSTLLRG
jgi:hypothetical protein